MKKQFLYLLLATVLTVQCSSIALARSTYASNSVRVAIHKYRNHNYTGCLQDCQNIVKRDPSNSLAYYYLAMAYTRAGKKDLAIKAYSRVIALHQTPRMVEYAATGKRCLETPDKCHPAAVTVQQSELDKFIASPSGSSMSSGVRKDYDTMQLNSIKNQINSGKSIDSYSLRRLNLKSDNDKKVASETPKNEVTKKPTNEDIVAALKVLKEAGMNPYSADQQQAKAMAAAANSYSQAQTADTMQNPEMAQLNMLMGNNSGQNNGSSAMMNMLPFILAQNKNGSTNYSPQLVQSMIMNSMMSSMNFDMSGKDKQY